MRLHIHASTRTREIRSIAAHELAAALRGCPLANLGCDGEAHARGWRARGATRTSAYSASRSSPMLCRFFSVVFDKVYCGGDTRQKAVQRGPLSGSGAP